MKHILIISSHAPSLINFRLPLIKELLSKGNKVSIAAPNYKFTYNFNYALNFLYYYKMLTYFKINHKIFNLQLWLCFFIKKKYYFYKYFLFLIKQVFFFKLNLILSKIKLVFFKIYYKYHKFKYINILNKTIIKYNYLINYIIILKIFYFF